MLKRNHLDGGGVATTKPSKTFAKGVAIASLVAGLSACSPKAEQISTPVMPEELKDCKTFFVRAENSKELYITRCPNSTTSTNYTSGKSSKTTVTIDGKEYIEKEPEKK